MIRNSPLLMDFRVKLAWLPLALLCLQCTFYLHRPSDDDAANPSANAGTGNVTPGGGIVGDPPIGEWVNTTGNLVEVPSGFGNMTLVSSSPYEDRLIAGVSEGGVWASEDGGESWKKIGIGKGSAEINDRPSMITYDPEDSRSFWVSESYGAGAFVTHDGGATFERLGTADRCDNINVDFGDPQRKTLLAGQHESAVIFLSTDAGKTWQDIGGNIGSGVNPCAFPLLLDGRTFLLTCNPFGGGKGGIFRSEDKGATWSQVSEGSADQSALLASDGSIYWSAALNGGLLASSDDGATWKQVLSDATTVRPIELPDGRIATINRDYILVSKDLKKWQPASAKLPFAPGGLVYSQFRRAFFIWHLSSDPMPPADAIARFDFDYEKN